MKHCLVLLICMLVFSIPAYSTDIEALASEFFRLNSPEQSLKANLMDQMDLMSPLLKSQSQSGDADAQSYKAVIDLLFGKDFSYTELEEISIPIITSQYSAAELEALNAFLKSPAGQAYLKNSAYQANYLTQAVKIYFERKAQDEDFIWGLIMSMFESFGLNADNADDVSGTPSDGAWDENWSWNWDEPAEPDTAVVAPWDDWTDENQPDSLAYDDGYDSWDDYWDTPTPVTITMNGKIMQSVDEIRYIFNEVLPAFKQIYDWLDAYTQEYGGYPFELDWSGIKPVRGYDLEYDHDSAIIQATSNASHSLPGIEIVFYLAENNIWISIPTQR